MGLARENIINVWIKIIEMLVTYAVFLALYSLKLPNYGFENQEFIAFLIFLGPVSFLVSLFLVKLYLSRTRSVSLIILSHFVASALVFAILLIFVEVCKLDTFDVLFLAVFCAVNFVLLCIVKYLILRFYSRKREADMINVVVVGTGNTSMISIIDTLADNILWNYNVVALFSDSQAIYDRYTGKYPIYHFSGDISDLSEYITKNAIHEVVYVNNSIDIKQITPLIHLCLEIGVTFKLSSLFLEIARAKGTEQYIGNNHVFSFQNTPSDYAALYMKKIFDFMFSLCALLLLSPILIGIAIAVKVTSKGPVLFKQTRVGLQRKEFKVWKFRTMIINAEDKLKDLQQLNEQDGPVFKIANDPRITKIGKFLRKTSLDELPQFFNVLKGDMSIVGPRPPIPAEVEQYERWQLRRLSVKPGITCIWQVHGRNQVSFKEWMKMDLQYIDTWSFRLDMLLIIQTVKVAFFNPTGQ
ncbi:MAG: sugar transferase [Bacteroidetes bacterium]|nr:sugar transferase [Bacteroidota bacterium]